MGTVQLLEKQDMGIHFNPMPTKPSDWHHLSEYFIMNMREVHAAGLPQTIILCFGVNNLLESVSLNVACKSQWKFTEKVVTKIPECNVSVGFKYALDFLGLLSFVINSQ